MAVVQMPANAVFTKRAWTPPSQNQVNRSGWTGARKVLRLPGAGVWKVTAAIKPISREVDSWPWKAFLTVLEGEANTFLMPFACQPRPAGALISALNGGVQGATSINLQTQGVQTGKGLRGGQAITVTLASGKRQLLLLTQDFIGDGQVRTAYFRGALRENFPAQYVEAVNPVCEMAMVGKPALDENEGVYTLGFDAEEAF